MVDPAHPPSNLQFPDLTSCCSQLPPTYHKNGDAIATASQKWFENVCGGLTDETRRRLCGSKAGKLSAYVYHDSDDEHLRVVCDFVIFFLHLDDLFDAMVSKETEVLADIVMNALSFPWSYHPVNGKETKPQPQDTGVGRLAQNFWARFIQDAGPGVQARFCESLGHYFDAIKIRARDRDNGTIPDLQSYIHDRRDNSGVKPFMDLLEYSLRIDLPDFVIKDPVIEALKQGTNDFVAWSNDIFSFKQARGDTSNLVTILMKHEGLDLQAAASYIGDMCRVTIDTFCENRKKVPLWGPEIDSDISRYVHGLENWIASSLHCSFISERYFGPQLVGVERGTLVKMRIQTNVA